MTRHERQSTEALRTDLARAVAIASSARRFETSQYFVGIANEIYSVIRKRDDALAFDCAALLSNIGPDYPAEQSDDDMQGGSSVPRVPIPPTLPPNQNLAALFAQATTRGKAARKRALEESTI